MTPERLAGWLFFAALAVALLTALTMPAALRAAKNTSLLPLVTVVYILMNLVVFTANIANLVVLVTR
jgi:hypothetical protein